MIIYSGNKKQFNDAVINNQIINEIELCFAKNGIRHENLREENAWRNSLNFMRNVLDDNNIPNDVNVAIEYQIPQTSKRVDFMIAGSGSNDTDNVVIIELKQWSNVSAINNDGNDNTIKCDLLGGRIVAHPSYQAYSYKTCIKNYCEYVSKENIELYPCAYLHNLNETYRSEISNKKYQQWLDEAPVFLEQDTINLRNFIKKYIKAKSKNGDILYKIDHGKIKPQKALQDSIHSMIKGNKEFLLLDDQIVAYDKSLEIIKLAVRTNKKHTIIIQGGPGTGKSVLAINLLANLIANYGYMALYVTKNAAPRNCYHSLLAKSSMAKADIEHLFPSAHKLSEFQKNDIQIGLFDEAHRLQEHAYMYKGDSMLEDAIDKSLVSIFFIDENQIVTTKDKGTINKIIEVANKFNSEVHYDDELKLTAQFRCNGSDEYIAFLNNLLEIENTANLELNTKDFNFKVYDDILKMREDLRILNNINNKARLVAGYCYDWNSKKDSNAFDIILDNGRFKAKWNLSNDKIWAINENSFDEVGCIHTCQGLEFDYVGVIIGKDLCYKNGHIVVNRDAISKDDKSSGVRNKTTSDELAKQIIKNTYKVLLTRGQKGCFVYCEDKNLADYIKSKLIND